MTKFILVLQICSALYTPCLAPIQDPTFYDTWRNCGIAGYEQGLNVFESLELETIEDSRIYIKFMCKEVESPDI